MDDPSVCHSIRIHSDDDINDSTSDCENEDSIKLPPIKRTRNTSYGMGTTAYSTNHSSYSTSGSSSSGRFKSNAIKCDRIQFESKSVGELKKLLLSFGLSSDGMLEKSEMRSALLKSERIVLIDECDLTSGNTSQASASSTTGPQGPQGSTPASDILQFPMDMLDGMNIREIKELMNAYSISYSNCVEKADMITAIEKSNQIHIIHTEFS